MAELRGRAALELFHDEGRKVAGGLFFAAIDSKELGIGKGVRPSGIGVDVVGRELAGQVP